MIQQSLLKERGAHKIIPIAIPRPAVPDLIRDLRRRRQFHNGGFQFDAPTPVQHMGQSDRAHLLRHPVGRQPIQQRFGIRPFNHHFGKGRDIHDPHPLAHRAHFLADHVMHHIAREGIVILLRHIARCKPARALKAIDLFMHRALGFQHLMQGRWFDRPPGQTVEMRKRNLMTQAVIFLCLDHLPLFRRIGPKAARIKLPHGDIRRPMHHPTRQFPGQARPPADPDLCATATPVILRPRCRTNQRVAIGRVRDRAMHLARDAKLCENRHSVQAFLQPRHDPVVIRIKEPVLIIPGAFIVPDRVRVRFLINPDQPAFLFHTDIAGHFAVIPDHRQFAFQISEFRYVFGDEIVVRHRRHGQLQARPFAHLAGVCTARIDHMLATDRALFALHYPFAI